MLHLLIFKDGQEAFKRCGCFCWIKMSGYILFFLLAFIVRSWSYVFCLNQDTAGSERYEAMSRIYYRGARAAIVCYGEIMDQHKLRLYHIQFRRESTIVFTVLRGVNIRAHSCRQVLNCRKLYLSIVSSCKVFILINKYTRNKFIIQRTLQDWWC